MSIYNYEKRKFKVEGIKGTFEGIHIPAYNWNGWKLPLFDLETAKHITRRQESKEAVLSQCGSFYTISEMPNGTIEYEWDNVTFYKAVDVEGTKYYHVGYQVWTWELAKG